MFYVDVILVSKPDKKTMYASKEGCRWSQGTKRNIIQNTVPLHNLSFKKSKPASLPIDENESNDQITVSGILNIELRE